MCFFKEFFIRYYERTTDPSGIRMVKLTSPSFDQENGDSNTCINL